MAAPKKNQNAQKGEAPASSFLIVRCRRDQKAGYVRKAVAAKQSLTEWVLEKLDRAAM
mgnify:CR=1 FL=1